MKSPEIFSRAKQRLLETGLVPLIAGVAAVGTVLLVTDADSYHAMPSRPGNVPTLSDNPLFLDGVPSTIATPWNGVWVTIGRSLVDVEQGVNSDGGRYDTSTVYWCTDQGLDEVDVGLNLPEAPVDSSHNALGKPWCPDGSRSVPKINEFFDISTEEELGLYTTYDPSLVN